MLAIQIGRILNGWSFRPNLDLSYIKLVFNKQVPAPKAKPFKNLNIVMPDILSLKIIKCFPLGTLKVERKLD